VSGQVELAHREAVVMGTPMPMEPHAAILWCIEVAGAEVRYASDRIAELAPEEAVGPVVMTLRRPMKEEKGGEDPEHEVEEVRYEAPALHIWVQARHQAMDRLVQYSAAALRAGIQKRLVELAEGQAQMLAEAMKRLAVALGHQPSDPKVREAMRGSLTLIAGGQVA